MSTPALPDPKNPKAWVPPPQVNPATAAGGGGGSYQETELPSTDAVLVTPESGNAAIWVELTGEVDSRYLIVDRTGAVDGQIVVIRPFVSEGSWSGIDFVIYNSNDPVTDPPSDDVYSRSFTGDVEDESVVELRFHGGRWNLWRVG